MLAWGSVYMKTSLSVDSAACLSGKGRAVLLAHAGRGTSSHRGEKTRSHIPPLHLLVAIELSASVVTTPTMIDCPHDSLEDPRQSEGLDSDDRTAVEVTNSGTVQESLQNKTSTRTIL